MHSRIRKILQMSTGGRIAIVALVWLAVISLLHFCLNFEHSTRAVLRMGYMPVITNLAGPVLDYVSRNDAGLRFEALKFGSFAEMGEALRNGSIQAAFIIAPLAIVLHQQGADVKIVYIGNRHESTLVYRKDLMVKSFADLAGKTVAVPVRYSGHNLAARRLAEKHGVRGSDLRIVEMNPPDMASALVVGSLDAYFVGEPFAAQTVKSGDSKVLHYVEEVWPGFICNLVLVTREYIDKHPDRVKQLVQGAARSGFWAREHPQKAAEIASTYWNQPLDLVEYTMTHPPDRFVFDAFVPKQEEIQYLADQMVRFDLLESADTDGLIDDRFAREANLEGITDLNSILRAP
ncbi:MAG: ABC transporter substrate-binding protein [Desulfomonilaceae bacterium]|nr:ABC transporter substrate-binding protein [Desulfomonilaceae bacterium]